MDRIKALAGAASIVLLGAALAGCSGLSVGGGGEGVFEPAAVQPPPSGRPDEPPAPAAQGTPARSERKPLSVPSR